MIGAIIHLLSSKASFAGWPGDFSVGPGPFILVEPIFLLYLFLFVASLVWVWKDANRRGKNGWVSLLFILATGWPVSLLWWRWLRPPLKNEVLPTPQVIVLPPVPASQGA